VNQGVALAWEIGWAFGPKTANSGGPNSANSETQNHLLTKWEGFTSFMDGKAGTEGRSGRRGLRRPRSGAFGVMLFLPGFAAARLQSDALVEV
jgi:hypothetical protein